MAVVEKISPPAFLFPFDIKINSSEIYRGPIS